MSMNKILVALVIAFAVVGLTGVSTASLYDYSKTTTSWQIAFDNGQTVSYTDTVTGTHSVSNTVEVGDTSINTETEVTLYEDTTRISAEESSTGSLYDYSRDDSRPPSLYDRANP